MRPTLSILLILAIVAGCESQAPPEPPPDSVNALPAIEPPANDGGRWARIIKPEIVSAEIKALTASDAFKDDDEPQRRDCLVVRVKFTNISHDRRPFVDNKYAVEMADSNGNHWGLLSTEDEAYQGVKLRDDPLPPGESFEDLYLFEAPTIPAVSFTLTLPVGAVFRDKPQPYLFGKQEKADLTIPADSIKPAG